MSAIDSIPHRRIGRFGRVPIYLCLADSPRLGTTGNDGELSSYARKNSMCVGGGSGEHAAIVLPDPASAARAYVEYVTREAVSEPPTLHFCDDRSAADWRDEFARDLPDDFDFPLWLSLALGEFILFMLPDLTPDVRALRTAHASYFAEAEPTFPIITIPWDTYRGNGTDYFAVQRKA